MWGSYSGWRDPPALHSGASAGTAGRAAGGSQIRQRDLSGGADDGVLPARVGGRDGWQAACTSSIRGRRGLQLRRMIFYPQAAKSSPLWTFLDFFPQIL
jgi:hypothetical protein